MLRNIPAGGAGRDRALFAARALLRETPDAAWPVLWPVIHRDVGFGLMAFEGVWEIWQKSPPNVAKKLGDDQLSDLYIWMETNVPRGDQKRPSGLAVIGSAQSLSWLRDILLTELKGRGTSAACAGLRRAMRELPQCPWLAWHLQEAEGLARSVAWKPLELAQLNALIASPESRLVQNADQLLEILIRSLSRLEQEMQGETPAGFFLWDEHTRNSRAASAGGTAARGGGGRTVRGRFRPKNELRISDCIKLHLQRDIASRGIVVNREVEIRKGTGGAPGEETDIRVDAVIKGSHDTYGQISVIIEVKGCWNRGVLSAMETQLADRYLRDNACPYGLYVVGWFVCDQWKDDPRKSTTPDMTLSDARGFFHGQAISLSNETRRLRSFVLNLALR